MRSRPERFCGGRSGTRFAAHAAALHTSGATPRVASQTRRVRAGIASSLLSPSRSLRLREVVAGILHLPEQHHLMVFVDGVVAVHRIAAPEVAEPHDQLDLLVELQPN